MGTCIIEIDWTTLFIYAIHLVDLLHIISAPDTGPLARCRGKHLPASSHVGKIEKVTRPCVYCTLVSARDASQKTYITNPDVNYETVTVTKFIYK